MNRLQMHNSYLIKKKYIQPYKQQAMHFNTTPLTQNQLLKQVTTIIWKSSTESRAKFSFLKSISLSLLCCTFSVTLFTLLKLNFIFIFLELLYIEKFLHHLTIISLVGSIKHQLNELFIFIESFGQNISSLLIN